MKSRRQIGAAFERFVAKALAKIHPSARRTYHAPGKPDIEGVPGFWIETRSAMRASIPAVLISAWKRSPLGSIPVAITRIRGKRAIVSMNRCVPRRNR